MYVPQSVVTKTGYIKYQVRQLCAEKPDDGNDFVMIYVTERIEYRNAIPTLSNGDPGYPDELDENVISEEFYDRNGARIIRPEWLTEQVYNEAEEVHIFQ